MVSTNVQIMRDIHNEQRDLSTSVSGEELYKHLHDLDCLTTETKMLLWRCRAHEKSFFDAGMLLDGEDKKSLIKDDKIHEAFDKMISAFLNSQLRIVDNQTLLPLAVLTEELTVAFYFDSDDLIYFDDTIDVENENIKVKQEEMLDFIAGLIECDTIAAWLLVSWL